MSRTKKQATNPLDGGPGLEELGSQGSTGADGEGGGDDDGDEDVDDDAVERAGGAAGGAPNAAVEAAPAAPPAAPPPPPAAAAPQAAAAGPEVELDDEVALVRVGYPVLCRRTGDREARPAFVITVHEDRSLELVVFHPTTWVHGTPQCSTFVGHVARARDDDPEAPGWLPLFIV